MSVAKHTPGPWQVNHNDPTQVCDSDGAIRGCAPVAQCSVGTAAERKANARLIAAAPSMLVALQQIAKAPSAPLALEYVQGLARAAIALTGETQ